MNLVLMLLKTGQTLIAQSEQLEYEPKVHLVNPMEVGGKTKVTLSAWPHHTNDEHILLHSDALLTVCEPTRELKEQYIKKVGIKEAELKLKPRPVMLNEDEQIPEVNDEYEPRYVEEPLY